MMLLTEAQPGRQDHHHGHARKRHRRLGQTASCACAMATSSRIERNEPAQEAPPTGDVVDVLPQVLAEDGFWDRNGPKPAGGTSI